MTAGRALALAALIVAPAASPQPPAGAGLAGVYVAVWVGEPEIVRGPDPYPMTEVARQAVEAFDPFVSDPRNVNDCAAEKLPTLLWSANPIEITEHADRIEIRLEEGGSARVIWLNGAAPPADQPYTAVGYSVGRWEDGTLVVVTTHLDSPTIVNDLGYPLSRRAVLTERYRKAPGDTLLRLDFQIEDPINYTEVLRYRRIWEQSQTEQLRPWECFSLGPRDDGRPPDFDELTRLLEELE
ncbi:MAG TPA: hypothetical protein VLD39_04405 [Gammaproteobacteria bacterium]|nr:hypothetical protein [Gammaproteobacteria bacterium]